MKGNRESQGRTPPASRSKGSQQIQILFLDGDERQVLILDLETEPGPRSPSSPSRAARGCGAWQHIGSDDLDRYWRNLMRPYKEWPNRLLLAEATSLHVPLGTVVSVRERK